MGNNGGQGLSGKGPIRALTQQQSKQSALHRRTGREASHRREPRASSRMVDVVRDHESHQDVAVQQHGRSHVESAIVLGACHVLSCDSASKSHQRQPRLVVDLYSGAAALAGERTAQQIRHRTAQRLMPVAGYQHGCLVHVFRQVNGRAHHRIIRCIWLSRTSGDRLSGHSSPSFAPNLLNALADMGAALGTLTRSSGCSTSCSPIARPSGANRMVPVVRRDSRRRGALWDGLLCDSHAVLEVLGIARSSRVVRSSRTRPSCPQAGVFPDCR